MANSEEINYLSPDKALKDPKQDRLGYKHFAKHLSESIWKMAPPEGFVIAIYGPWGSGKSTLLNFLEYYLKQMPETEQPIIVHFNPWWFSGHEDLTIRFFGQLQAALLNNGERGNDYKDLKKKLASFTRLVAKAPIPDPSAKVILHIGGNILSDILSGKEDIVELKDKIAKDLENINRKILVIIDDIDRLTEEEIRQLFRVIKAIADFPNMMYLLSFDKDIVIKSLDGIQGKNGESYLEKIVQLQFDLPVPDKIALQEILRDRLKIILADTPEELIDKRYRSDAYLRHIGNFINTPRDIIRLANTLSVTYPSVKGEVNFVDFIFIETLRVFIPASYDMIRRNSVKFTGGSRGAFGGSFVEMNKEFHNKWIKELPENDRGPVKQLVVSVFPLLAAIWGGSHFRLEDWGSRWRRERRVCIEDLFHIYFKLVLPNDMISYGDMNHLISLSYNSSVFAAKLLELAEQKRSDGITSAYEFLWRLRDYTKEEIPKNNISNILKAFFDIGDDLLISEISATSSIDIQMSGIIWQLLLRLDEPEQFEILKDSMSEGGAISTIVSEVGDLRQIHDEQKEDEKTNAYEIRISSKYLDQLEKIVLRKVRDAARNGTLLKIPNLVRVLYWWIEFDGKDVRLWVEEAIKDDDDFAIFLEKFQTKGHRGQLALKSLGPFLDPSQIIDRARRIILSEGITENQRKALEQFIDEYDKSR